MHHDCVCWANLNSEAGVSSSLQRAGLVQTSNLHSISSDWLLERKENKTLFSEKISEIFASHLFTNRFEWQSVKYGQSNVHNRLFQYFQSYYVFYWFEIEKFVFNLNQIR